ncbi:hypothetical protein ACOMHN_048405 [Nucella lapillus]
MERVKLKEEVDVMKKPNADLFKKLNQQEKQIVTLTRAQNDVEQHGRKWNLRVFNIPESKPEESESSAECAKKVCHIFSTMVGASVSEEDIEIAHRVGQRMTSGSTRSRAIIVIFHSRQKKDGVLANRRRLKGNAKKLSIAPPPSNGDVPAFQRRWPWLRVGLAWLHAAPACNLLATVGARMDHVFAPVHTKGDQAAAKVTPDEAEDEADDPGEGASVFSSPVSLTGSSCFSSGQPCRMIFMSIFMVM